MDLLEEAKLRYPRGSKIIGINTKDIKQNINCGKEITLDGTFYLQKKNEHVYRSSDAIYASPNVYVYSQETWAKIIEYKIPDKWCVKVNSSYNDYFELHNWRKDIWKNSGYIDSDKVWMPTKRDSYTEIRIEDFIKYIYKEEESLIGRYAKIILKGDINEGKYYLITSKNYATRLFDNVENCSFSNNFNWEIMPKDFVYTGQDNVPQYVKCVKSWHSVWTTDKVYKTEKEQLDFPNTLRVKDDTEEVIKVYSWDAPTTFKISTEEEYLAQQTLVKQTIPEYWAVKYTESNFDTLEHWRLSQKDVDKIYNVSVGIYLVSKHHDDSYLLYCSDIKNQSKYKEIPFEDFKKHFSIEEVKKYAVDVYEKKDKSIKQIELPKPKKRLIF